MISALWASSTALEELSVARIVRFESKLFWGVARLSCCADWFPDLRLVESPVVGWLAGPDSGRFCGLRALNALVRGTARPRALFLC